jgi:hypothetical protein
VQFQIAVVVFGLFLRISSVVRKEKIRLSAVLALVFIIGGILLQNFKIPERKAAGPTMSVKIESEELL